jgi:hypothetical protein
MVTYMPLQERIKPQIPMAPRSKPEVGKIESLIQVTYRFAAHSLGKCPYLPSQRQGNTSEIHILKGTRFETMLKLLILNIYLWSTAGGLGRRLPFTVNLAKRARK